MEIDTEFHKGPFFQNKRNVYLPFIIDRVPKSIPESMIPSNAKDEYYEKLDNNTIHINIFSEKHSKLDSAKFFVYGAIALGIVFPFYMFITSEDDDTSYVYYISLIALLICFIPAYINWKNAQSLPDEVDIVFDRLNDIVTIPKADQRFGSYNIRFRHVKAARIRIGFLLNQAANKPQLNFYNDPYKKLFGSKGKGYINMSLYNLHDAQETWSMYVWYMDKNRPLPPGTAFDQYRDEDFERRKAEGFPPPLYKSVVPTPEATPEQQTEREQYWKDETYMVDAKEAKYNLLDGFKKK